MNVSYRKRRRRKTVVDVDGNDQNVVLQAVAEKRDRFRMFTAGSHLLEGDSLCIFKPNCCLRRFLFSVLFNPLTEFVRVYLTIANTVIFILSQSMNFGYTFVNYLFLLFLAIDVFLQIFTLGFIVGPHTYLRSDIWHAVDLFVLVIGCSLIYFVNFSPFRIVVIFKLVSGIPFLSSLQAILHASWAVVPRVKGVVILIFFIYLMFVLSGVDFFKSDVGRRCVLVTDKSGNSGQIVPGWNQSISSFRHLDEIDPLKYSVMEMIPPLSCSFSNNEMMGGTSCPDTALCVNGNPGFYEGLGRLDSWPLAALAGIQLLNLGGWSKYVENLIAVEGPYLPFLWSALTMFLSAIVLLNIFISAIEAAFSLKKEQKLMLASRGEEITQYSIIGRIIAGIPASLVHQLPHFLTRSLPCYRFLERVQRWLAWAVTSFVFDLVITLIISVNVLLEFVLVNKEIRKIVGDVFIFVYLAEAMIKFLCLGLKYFQNPFNLVDLTLVIVTVTMYVITEGFGKDYQIHGYLYVIRYLRIVSILSTFPITRPFMNKVTHAFLPAMSLILFDGGVIFVFSLIANTVFQNAIVDNVDRNFNTFQSSFVSLFVILTGDDWELVPYEILSSSPQTIVNETTSGWEARGWFSVGFAAPFFGIFFVISNVFLVQFFTAVVLHAFGEANDEEGSQLKNFKKQISSWWSGLRSALGARCHKSGDRQKSGCLLCCEHFREELATARESRFYGILVLVFCVGATVVLFFDPLVGSISSGSTDSMQVDFHIQIIDIVLCGVFGLDFLFGIVCYGLCYFVSIVHLLDLVFLWELIATVAFEQAFGRIPWFLVYFRIIARSLRPLKIVWIFPDLRLYIQSFRNMLLAFVQLSLLLGLALVIYGIIGNQLFADMFSGCTDRSRFSFENFDQENVIQYKNECVDEYVNDFGILAPRAYVTERSNFDSIGESISSLAEIATLDDWSQFLYRVIRISGDEFGIESIYFMSYVVIVVMFVVTLSVGIILDGIMEEREVIGSKPKQKHWAAIQRYVYGVNPKPLQRPMCPCECTKCGFCNCFCECFWNCGFVQHWSFRVVVFIVIAVNYVAIATQYVGLSYLHETVIVGFSLLCFALFCVEDVFKLLATGVSYFFSDIWNLIDIVLFVSACVLLVLFGILSGEEVGDSDTVRLLIKAFTRLMLFGRLVALATSIPSVRRILSTLVLALPSIVNAFILLIIIVVCYCLIGRVMFGNVRFGEFYNQRVNFREWPKGFMLLLKVLTFDEWRGIMHDLSIAPPYCTSDDVFNDCGMRWFAVLYFGSFAVIVSTLALNLFVGIVLDSFSLEFLESGFPITREVVDEVKDVWAGFDRNALGLIRMVHIEPILLELLARGSILGFDRRQSRTGCLKYWILRYELSHQVHYTDSEVHAHQYIFRFNPFLLAFRFWMGLKKCCYSFWRGREKTTVNSFQKDMKHVAFNDFLLALCRLAVKDSARTVEERNMRREFLREAVEKVHSIVAGVEEIDKEAFEQALISQSVDDLVGLGDAAVMTLPSGERDGDVVVQEALLDNMKVERTE